MKTYIHCLCMVSGFLLFFQTNAQAQNLNQTVTHGSGTTATMPVSNSHKEGRMPQGDKEKFGDFYGLVTVFKDYFSRALPKAASSGLDDGIGLSSYDWKQWTEEDLRKLATTYNGIDMFSGLSIFKNNAILKDATGGYTKDAIHAQNALTELKPDACKNWKSFFNMIIRVEEATKSERIPLMKRKKIQIPGGETGALLDLHKNENIAGDHMENPAFDKQAALTQLEKAGVTKDVSDSLKKPLETAVTDAVKSIKSAITLAA